MEKHLVIGLLAHVDAGKTTLSEALLYAGGQLRKLYTDKKVRAGQLRFVFQKGIGDMMCFGENVYSRPVEEALVREILPEM